MPRNYRNISMYEQEILEMKSQGKTLREIGKQLGFSYEQVHNFISRHNEKQRKIAAGIALKKKGIPAKDSVVSQEDKLADLRYKLSRKDARIRQLEMENELMRDFLSLTERK
jgi:lambda repressor-like predicted transcriptional regulator